MRSATLVFNPFAGRWRSTSLIQRLMATLARSGFDVEPLPTRGAGDASDRARQAAAGGAEVVFALGGDGTLRECAAGLLGSETALAFLPTGTINVMAMELGLPLRPLAAARAYARATVRPFGVGLAGDTPFLMQASAGVDAFLIAALRPLEKKLMGPVAAVPAAIRSLLRYSFPAFEVTTAAGTRTVTLAVAANIRRYGGPWQLTPGARSDGERLELFSYSGRGRAAIIGLALSLLVGRHLKAAGSRVESVRKVTIQAAGALPFQIDGDMLAPARDRPLEITVSDHKISMLAPAP